MWKFAFVLLLAAVCVHAEDEKPSEKGPSLVETALCYIAPKPWQCIKEQAGRMLNHWDVTLDDKRHELMVEADEEMVKKETTRGLNDDEKNQMPSEVIGAVDKTVSAIANMMTGGTDVQGREIRAIKGQSKDVNDFNDEDYSIIDEFAKVEGKGKKKKKTKKALMKMFFLGAIVKSKIELLLKVLSFHLQLKFFAIALAGLLINLARFWIDIKKSHSKHHYDNEHEDWGGSSWKRQSPQVQEYPQENFAHRLAYGAQQQYPQQK